MTAAVVAAGFVEVLSFPFLSIEELDKLGVPAGDRRRRLNRITNPLAETSPYLRSTLLPGLFGAVARNRSRGNDDLAIFETGSVFFAAQTGARAPRPSVAQRPTADELAAMDAALGAAAEAPGSGADRELAFSGLARHRPSRPAGSRPSR